MKHHDSHKANDALQRLIKCATGDRGATYGRIPADQDMDADLILAAVIDERDVLRAALQELVRTADVSGDAFEKAIARAREALK